MRNKTKALSGAAQDAYFRRVLKAYSGLPAGERERLLLRLRQEVAQLRIRSEPAETPPAQAATLAQQPSARRQFRDAVRARALQPTSPAGDASFDPFTPNVIVVLRQHGREAALAALAAIDSPDDLRLLARGQRLSIGAGLASASELRSAIVAAAERRIANRMAAAS